MRALIESSPEPAARAADTTPVKTKAKKVDRVMGRRRSLFSRFHRQTQIPRQAPDGRFPVRSGHLMTCFVHFTCMGMHEMGNFNRQRRGLTRSSPKPEAWQKVAGVSETTGKKEHSRFTPEGWQNRGITRGTLDRILFGSVPTAVETRINSLLDDDVLPARRCISRLPSRASR